MKNNSHIFKSLLNSVEELRELCLDKIPSNTRKEFNRSFDNIIACAGIIFALGKDEVTNEND